MKLIIPKNIESKSSPKNYVCAIDVSGSMWNSIKDLKETIRAAKDLMQTGDTFTLGYFSSTGEYSWICKGASNLGGIDKLIEEKIYARGLTNFTEILKTVDSTVNDVVLTSGNTENVFLWLSDGYNNCGGTESEILKICSSLKSLFVHKMIIGYSSYYDRNLLLKMSENIGGTFSHVSDHSSMNKATHDFVGTKKKVKVIELPKCFDLIWQVSNGEIITLECGDKKVSVLETDADNELFGVDYDELDSLPDSELTNAAFVYSLAYVLSQKNKANLGVNLLRKVGVPDIAKMLQKAFTVAQKGNAENELKRLAGIGGDIVPSTGNSKNININDFLETISKNLGNVSIDLGSSSYNSISRKGDDVSKVKFENSDKLSKIVSITQNENRANISFLTVRKGLVTSIEDKELFEKVWEYNKTSETPILLTPIETETYRNYTFVANGDFNFDKLVLNYADEVVEVDPSKDIDLFDDTVQEIKIQDFVNLNKALIAEKAHASVLRFYIKKYSEQKHAEDLRVTRYGAEGAKLLEEMGFDYAMRYSPKKEYVAVDKDNMDYVPFLEINTNLSGASKIDAKTSYEKYLKKGKQNPGDLITWPWYEKYDQQYTDLGKEVFVELCQTALNGIDKTVDVLSQKISSTKFYLMITNSWFVGVDKSDEFEYDDLVIKTKETKEYL